MPGAALLAIWLASSLCRSAAECTGGDCSEETCPCVSSSLIVAAPVRIRSAPSYSGRGSYPSASVPLHRYANGPSSKAKREETPYEMYALGSDEPEFCA